MSTANENSATVQVNLEHDHNINGVSYPKGSRNVPREIADSIMQADHKMMKTEADYSKKRVSEVDAGHIAVGGNN